MTERVFTQTFGVVSAILERGGNILLVRESQEKGPDNGKWNHPAGWIDVGEDPVKAIKREVREETGFTFTPKNILGIYSLVRRDIESFYGSAPHCIKIVFLGTIDDKPSSELAGDVSETRWFTPEEIYAMDGTTLRDADIKQMVIDYVSGKRYPLDLLVHADVKHKS